ncbi:MAG: GNAT family N-acetyltransferase [Chloroflexota bacterium]
MLMPFAQFSKSGAIWQTICKMALRADITIRKVDLVDYENLVHFLADNNIPEIVRYFRPFPFTSETAQYIARQPHRDRYFVAILNHQIVGLSMLRGWDEGFSIPSFGVMVDHRIHGKGIGKHLLEYTLDEACKLKCHRVRLSVYASNTVAIRLYEAMGFYEETRQAVMVGQEADEKIIMFKDLS